MVHPHDEPPLAAPDPMTEHYSSGQSHSHPNHSWPPHLGHRSTSHPSTWYSPLMTAQSWQGRSFAPQSSSSSPYLRRGVSTPFGRHVVTSCAWQILSGQSGVTRTPRKTMRSS